MIGDGAGLCLYVSNTPGNQNIASAKRVDGAWSVVSAFNINITAALNSAGVSVNIRAASIGDAYYSMAWSDPSYESPWRATFFLAKFRDAEGEEVFAVGVNTPIKSLTSPTLNPTSDTSKSVYYYDAALGGDLRPIMPVGCFLYGGSESDFEQSLQPIFRNAVSAQKLYRDITFDGAYLYLLRNLTNNISVSPGEYYRVDGATYQAIPEGCIVPIMAGS